MKKQAVIKSERSLKMVTNLVAKKVANRLWRYKTYQVEVKELVKGKINHVIIKNERSHMLTKYVIDDAWVVIDEYEKKVRPQLRIRNHSDKTLSYRKFERLVINAGYRDLCESA